MADDNLSVIDKNKIRSRMALRMNRTPDNGQHIRIKKQEMSKSHRHGMMLYFVWLYQVYTVFFVKDVSGSIEEENKFTGGHHEDRFHYQQASKNSASQYYTTIYDDYLYEHLDLSLTEEELDCVNLRPNCDQYAAAGACVSDSLWMFPHCPVSCNACADSLSLSSFTYRPIPQSVPIEQSFGFREWKDSGVSLENAVRMGDSIQPPQRIVVEHEEAIREHILRVQRYLYTVVDRDPKYAPVRALCRAAVQHTDCAYWASSALDWCSESPDFMKEHGCTLFCLNCETLHIESKCPIDINEKSAWYAPNDLNDMFLSILKEQSTSYNITVLSRPSLTEGDNSTNDGDAPWVLQIDNFLSTQEARALIELGADIGYARSTGTGALDSSGQQARQVSRHRTSTNAWCDTEECNDHPVVQSIYERIFNFTHVPSEHSESLQLLRYEVGQFYKVHHDFIDIEVRRQQGVRIFTFFLYLNTLGANMGGGTNFPRLNLTVQPMVGRAILWPNVLNRAPNVKDDRTAHQALVVEQGVKYGANAWYHQRPLWCDEEE